MKPCNTYDVVKYAKEFKKGNTIMKNYGTPRARCAVLAAFSQRCTTTPDKSISLWVNPNLGI